MKKMPLIPGYILESKVGQGGVANVYKGTQQKLNRCVAVKILNPSLLQERKFAERFYDEARIASQLVHPNIITIHDINKSGDCFYITMEYLQESLRDRLDIRHSFPVNEAFCIVKQIALALDYAHSRSVIHRDIKPANILFKLDGTAVLADFGLALDMERSTVLTEQGSFLGTLNYASPEQFKGEHGERASDIYSLGCVLYEMLTGNVPYKSKNTRGLIKKILNDPVPLLPEKYNRYQFLLDQMMDKNKRHRIQSGKQVIEIIEKIKSNRKVSAKFEWKKTKIAVLIALTLILVIVFIVTLIDYPGSQGTHREMNPVGEKSFVADLKVKEPPTSSITVFDSSKYQKQPDPPTPQSPKTTQIFQPNAGHPSGTITPNNTQNNYTEPVTTPQPEFNSANEVISVNRLDPDIRQAIEARISLFVVEVPGISEVIKTGAYQVIIELNKNGNMESVDLSGLDVKPIDKAVELKSRLKQSIENTRFPPPTINGKSVNVKVGISYKISIVKNKVILEKK